ncbi:AT-rich interactive domain-containing protein 3B, partial [Geodia barretti]
NCKWREGTRREPKIPLQRPPLAKPHLSPCTARHETAARAGSGVFPGKARVMEGEDCDTEDYKKRRAEFVEKVFRFHERRGTPLKRLPMLGGRELNIYHLYQEVEKRGGSEKVTRVRMWGEIARTFNLPSTVTSASYAIRNHFIK